MAAAVTYGASEAFANVNQSSYLFGALIFAFLIFITARGDLGAWLGVFWTAAGPATPGSTATASGPASAGSTTPAPTAGTSGAPAPFPVNPSNPFEGLPALNSLF